MDSITANGSEPAARPLNVAAILFVMTALWVAPAAWCGYKLYADRPAASADDDKLTADEKALRDTLRKSADDNRPSYVVVLVLSAVGGIVALGGGLWISSARATQRPETHVRSSTVLLVLVGGLTGLLMMAVGVWFLVDEYKLLADWLTRKETKPKDLWRVLVPALVFIGGTGIAFLASQPARRLERHDQIARRLVYGVNLFVTGLLLFAALVLVNGFVALRLPNKLDTTQTGYYSIDAATEEYIRSLTEKVSVYVIEIDGMPGSNETDVLLEACQQLNPSKFVVRRVGQGAGPAEIQKLRAKFPTVDFANAAMIVAVGEDETRYSMVRASEIVRTEQTRPPEPPRRFYDGESRLVREILFLTEGKNRSTVYFTQGNGELSLGVEGGRRPSPDRSITELKASLEKSNLQVLPLPFDAKDPKIPDDAAVIVVADPTLPLGKELAGALTKYMTEPRADGKKGKMIVLAAPHGNPKGDAVQSTGLDELLRSFNVALEPTFLFNRPQSEQDPPELVLALASDELQSTGHPVARTLPPASRGIPVAWRNVRALTIVQPGNAAIRTVPLVETVGGREYYTWQETEEQADTDAAFKRFVAQVRANQADVIVKKKLSIAPIPLAVVATEETTPRLMVVGTGDYFNDATAGKLRNSTAFRLMGAGIDWLRDRPVVDVASKPYGYYTPQAKMDRMRLLFLPFVLTALAVAGLAAGVWVIRRK